MARPKEFDVDDALKSALEVFWAKGYDATSMQDLVDAMGIQKASLYGTFGDKHSLYFTALQRYQAETLARMRQHLTTAESPRQALHDLLSSTAEQAAGRGGKRGCFCVNANVELAPHDQQVAEQLRSHSEHVEEVLEDALRRARTRGELPKKADCKQLATFVLGLLVAINVLGKQKASRERLQAIVDQGGVVLGM